MLEEDGSDLHITVGTPPRIRKGGSLIEMSAEKLLPDVVKSMIESKMSAEQLQRFKSGEEIDYSIGIPGLSRFRVNVFSQRGNIAAAYRRLPIDPPKLESLGLPDSVVDLSNKRKGLILITGATGSGKSTTLYASLMEIQNEGINITTVEDPVEYQLDGVNQVQVFEDIGLTFGSTLRSILRQDPDVLLIGEIRDGETADIAVKFALTGHLVFSTVHANDAPGTITRLLDIGIAPFLVGSCLNLVMAQRLVRRLCNNCKEEYKPSDQELGLVGLDPNKVPGPLYRAKGCAECRNTGYKGRLAIFEMIPMARNLRKLVFDNANEDDLRQASLKNGMETLREAGLARVLDGTTTIEEILRSCSRNSFFKYLIPIYWGRM